MWDLLLKAGVGAVVVVVIQLLVKSKYFFVAGLAPLFPTFTIISHVIVAEQCSQEELKSTLRFNMISMIPYGLYLLVLYLLVDRMKLVPAMLCATGAWFAAAIVLILLWTKA